MQINRKYDFLSKAKVCLDLCAAPGGWCQVAARHMPSESVILGIDLLPIRPIRNVKTIVQDITTAVRSLGTPCLSQWVPHSAVEHAAATLHMYMTRRL